MDSTTANLAITLFLLGVIILGFISNWLKLSCDNSRFYFLLGGVAFGYFIGRLVHQKK